MSISERLNPDQSNIHQFQEVPEQQEVNMPFDVERDIDSVVKHKLEERIEKTYGYETYMDMYAQFRALWPNEQLPNVMAEVEIKRRAERLKARVANGMNNMSTYLHFCANALRCGYKIELTSEDIDEIREFVKEDRDFTSTDLFFDCNIISPNLMPFDQADIKRNIRLLAKEKKQQQWGWQKRYALQAARLKVIYFSYEPVISADLWEKLKKPLSQLSTEGDSILEYARYAVSLKILGSKSARITAPGVLNIRMPSLSYGLAKERPLPEQKKF